MREGIATDRERLTKSQYATGDNLEARRGLYEFVRPPADFASWVLDRADLSGRVLDVGCGTGFYLKRVPAAVGVDLSAGMLRGLARVAVADAQALPFGDDAFDAVLSLHMLYHVPDIPLAVAELRRVLRDGGTLLAATNGKEHLQEIGWTFDAAVSAVAGERIERWRPSVRFTLEDGEPILRSAFSEVECLPFHATVVLDDPAPMLRHLTSARDAQEPALPAGTRYDDVVAEVERIVRAAIAERGTFTITANPGVFVCR